MLSANQIAIFLNKFTGSLINRMSQNKLMKQKLFEHFLVGHGQNGCGKSGLWTLKLTLSQEITDGINWFLHAGTSLCKLKGDRKLLKWA